MRLVRVALGHHPAEDDQPLDLLVGERVRARPRRRLGVLHPLAGRPHLVEVGAPPEGGARGVEQVDGAAVGDHVVEQPAHQVRRAARAGGRRRGTPTTAPGRRRTPRRRCAPPGRGPRGLAGRTSLMRRTVGQTPAMLTSESRILTTHAGSLPRPPALAELHGRAAGARPSTPTSCERAIEEATAAVDRQAGRGRHRHRQRRRAGAGELRHLRAAPHDRVRRHEPAPAHARPGRAPRLPRAGPAPRSSGSR